jgi:hypothetical protein
MGSKSWAKLARLGLELKLYGMTDLKVITY